jgi:hypothetical protein
MTTFLTSNDCLSAGQRHSGFGFMLAPSHTRRALKSYFLLRFSRVLAIFSWRPFYPSYELLKGRWLSPAFCS